MAEDTVDTSVDTEVAQGSSGGTTNASAFEELVKVLTDRIDKMQTDYKTVLSSITESLDIGSDESQKRGVADASDEWSSIARHRASQLQKSANALDHLQQMAFNNSNFALGVCQLMMVQDMHQQGSQNWAARCGKKPGVPS